MKLEVGMYVRTKGGFIDKIISFKSTISNDYLELDDEYYANIKDILKASYNIIDLIEEGDYVNDEKIVDIGCLTNGPERGTKTIDYYIAPNIVYYFKNEDIKSIVTKEQFESISYKVGDSNE